MSLPVGATVAVIGAGIVGVSCAFFLQDEGYRVLLVDRAAPGSGTSFGNAGILSEGSVLPLGTPDVLGSVPKMLADRNGPLSIRPAYIPRLLPWFARLVLASRPERVEQLSRAIAALVDHAGASHDLLIQRCGLGELVAEGGWLKVARDRHALQTSTRLEREFLDRRGRAYQLLSEQDLRDLEPALAPDVKAGLMLPNNRQIRSPVRYTQGIFKHFLELGGHFLERQVDEIVFDNANADLLRTDRGLVQVDGVVVAAGAFSKRLAAAAGTTVPLDAERGYHAMLPHPPTSLNRPIYSIDHGFVLAPMVDGLRLTSGVELASPWAAADYRRLRRLVPLARDLVPRLTGEILSVWQGNRPSLPDSLPVIGPAPSRNNVWFAFGHQHIGLTLGPLTGRLIANLVRGDQPFMDLADYRADRVFF